MTLGTPSAKDRRRPPDGGSRGGARNRGATVHSYG